jgi:hypothetical protein
MSRVVTFGKMPDQMPDGNFMEVSFPELARLDEGTNEGWMSRVLSSDGAGSRDLPRTISFQELDTVGHDQAAAVGSIWEVTVDGETGVMSGRGFLADDDWGHKAAFAIKSKKLFHNSVDLAEVQKTSIETNGLDPWDDDFKVTLTFDEWKYGKTTIVALPAFANAHAMTGDELKASFADEGVTCLVVDCPSVINGGSALEASAATEYRPKWDYFHVPEADHLQAITVGEADDDGWVPIVGHLADWNKQTMNASGRLVFPPRGADDYRTYCAGKVLTDKGFVRTGPVTLLGGHITLQEALEKVENTWADVRVTDGRFGPWICGVVRPHVAADVAQTYAARASQISGLWPDGKTLRLISSVNAAGFEIVEQAEDYEFALAASLGVNEFVPMPQSLKSFQELTDTDQRTVREWVAEALKGRGEAPHVFGNITVNIADPSTSTVDGVITSDTEASADETTEDLLQAAVEERARRLAEGGLADLLEVE